MMNNRRITRQSVDRDGNRYCGPLVIAALLGCSTTEAAAKVRAATGTDRAIKGMYNNELLRTISAHGFNVVTVEVPKRYVARRRRAAVITPRLLTSTASESWRKNTNE